MGKSWVTEWQIISKINNFRKKALKKYFRILLIDMSTWNAIEIVILNNCDLWIANFGLFLYWKVGSYCRLYWGYSCSQRISCTKLRMNQISWKMDRYPFNRFLAPRSPRSIIFPGVHKKMLSCFWAWRWWKTTSYWSP